MLPRTRSLYTQLTTWHHPWILNEHLKFKLVKAELISLLLYIKPIFPLGFCISGNTTVYPITENKNLSIIFDSVLALTLPIPQIQSISKSCDLSIQNMSQIWWLLSISITCPGDALASSRTHSHTAAERTFIIEEPDHVIPFPQQKQKQKQDPNLKPSNGFALHLK